MGSNFSAVEEVAQSVSSSCACLSSNPNQAVGGRTLKSQSASWKDMYQMGGNMLHAAAIRGDEYAAKQLVVQEGYVIDAKDRAGRTPFILACRYGRVNTAKLLLRLGADFDATDLEGHSAMHGIQHTHTRQWLEKYHRTGRVSEAFEYHNVSKRETPNRPNSPTASVTAVTGHGSRRGSAHSTVSANSVVSKVQSQPGDSRANADARSVASSLKSEPGFRTARLGSFKAQSQPGDSVGGSFKAQSDLGDPDRDARSVARAASSFKSESSVGPSEQGSFKAALSSRFRALTPKKLGGRGGQGGDRVGSAPRSSAKLGLPPRSNSHVTPTKAKTPTRNKSVTGTPGKMNFNAGSPGPGHNLKCASPCQCKEGAGPGSHGGTPTRNKENKLNGVGPGNVPVLASPGMKRRMQGDEGVLSPVSPSTRMKTEMGRSMSAGGSMLNVNVQGGASPDVRRLMTAKSQGRRGSARSFGSNK